MRSSLRTAFVCLPLCFFIRTAPLGAQPPQPPAAPAQTSPQSPQQTNAELPKKAKDTTGDNVLSVEVFGFLPRSSPSLKAGLQTIDVNANLNFPSSTKPGGGFLVAVPAGRLNTLQISAFVAEGSGTTTAPKNLTLFGQSFPTGDQLVVGYRIINTKISWNYYTYPDPPTSKLRFRTLWEVQYTTMNSRTDAPLDNNATRAAGTKSLIYPTIGGALEYHVNRNLRFDLKGSGFGVPHHAVIWDAEAAAVIRTGKLDIHVGGKAFHLKTSVQGDQYYSATLWGPYLGIQWSSR